MAFFNENTENARFELAKAIKDGKAKLDSNAIKSLLFEYFRFKKGFLGVTTEMALTANNIEDFVAFNKDEIVAVEIKVSKSDFKADFKKNKYSTFKMRCHKFYFCVPLSLKDFVLDYFKVHSNEFNMNCYGVLVVNDDLSISAVKKAHYLREKGNIFKLYDGKEDWWRRERGEFVMDNLAYYLILNMSCELAKAKILKSEV